jgi:hypothetical protein
MREFLLAVVFAAVIVGGVMLLSSPSEKAPAPPGVSAT